eukprot:1110012-Karenia_brevis.AAC.1
MRLYNNDNYRESLGADPSEPWQGSHAGERIATTPFRDKTGIADLDQFRSTMGISSQSAAQVVAKNAPHRPNYVFTFWDEQRAPNVRITCPAVGPPPGDI